MLGLIERRIKKLEREAETRPVYPALSTSNRRTDET